MLICNLSELPLSGSAAHDLFKSRWGRENCILWGRASQAAFGPCTHTLSIRAAWGGQERCQIDGRTVAVDDDNFLILNHGTIYSTRIDAPSGVESLAICFSPEWIERLHVRQQCCCDDQSLRSISFLDNLHPHDDLVSPMLRLIRSELIRGLEGDAWFEERLMELLTRMQRHLSGLLQRMNRLPLVRSATRSSTYRKIALATDFIHTHYACDIDLDSMSRAATLSKFHFTRLFTLVHGLTPRTYLQRKRALAAVRLMQSSTLTTDEVAAAVGFHDEGALRRQLKCWENSRQAMSGHAAMAAL